MLITPDIARKYGWKIGDHIPLTSAVLQQQGTGNWVFDVVGWFTAHEPSSGGYIVCNYKYLDQARVANKGTVRNFYVSAADAGQAAKLAETIDQMFANAPSETSTASMRENAQQAMQSIGDLNFVIRSVLTAVFAALLFSTATMMMQNIRERTAELGILKTLGFTHRAVYLLIIAEGILVYVTGTALGLSLALFAFPYSAKFIPGLTMPLVVIEAAVVAACLVAFVSATLPALRAARLRVVDALADR